MKLRDKWERAREDDGERIGAQPGHGRTQSCVAERQWVEGREVKTR